MKLDDDFHHRFNSVDDVEKAQLLREVSDWFNDKQLYPALDSCREPITHLDEIKRSYELLREIDEIYSELELWFDRPKVIVSELYVEDLSATHPNIPKSDLEQFIKTAIEEVEQLPNATSNLSFPYFSTHCRKSTKEFLDRLSQSGYGGVEEETILDGVLHFLRQLNGYSRLTLNYLWNSDGEATKKKEKMWTEPKKIVLENCSAELAKFLAGGSSSIEYCFTATFSSDQDGTYQVHVQNEGYGNQTHCDIKRLLPEDITEYVGKLEHGFGHTHRTGTEVNTFSGSDMALLETWQMFRPHILLTPSNAVLYVPFSGFHYIKSEQIKVETVNQQKSLTDVSPY